MERRKSRTDASISYLLVEGITEDPVIEIKLESIHKESIWVTAVQMCIPFILSGFGMVAASYLLDNVQYWPVFQSLSEMNILVIALLGLKGNLEMTLASRLSTHANLGHFDNNSQKKSLIVANIALVLCQAVVIGFLASLAAIIFGWIPDGAFNVPAAIVLCASSVTTALCASMILSVVMVWVIVFSRKHHINPDNVATPIAASLGDITTLTILSWIASVFFNIMNSNIWIASVSLALCLSSAPLWAWFATKNEFTQKVLISGWKPVILAMMISSVGGLILNVTLLHFKGVALFQLIINGVGGNLVAVQASRMSTELHHVGAPGFKSEGMVVCITPCTAFSQDTKFTQGNTAKMLLGMAIPGHLIFCYLIGYLKSEQVSVTLTFVVIYMTVAITQVMLLLYFAQVMTLCMWKRGIDPDNSAIPYLTALGDLIGSLLLGIAFQVLYLISDKGSKVGQ